MAGKLTVASLRKAFAFYNERLFGGRLTEPKFRVCRMKSDLARWYSPSDELPAGLMVVAGNLKHDWGWQATLVHELCHVAVPEMEADHHGPLFTAEANRVGALLGVEFCHEDDAWCWPLHGFDIVPCDGSAANILDE